MGLTENSYRRLIAEIEEELNMLRTLRQRLDWALHENLPEYALTAVVGKILHDFYTGLEIVFEKIARETKEGLPTGEAWHRDLLNVMSLDIPETRPPVISRSLTKELYEYLRFRHLFRNIYVYELSWERMEPLAKNFPRVLDNVIADIVVFCDFLRTVSA